MKKLIKTKKVSSKENISKESEQQMAYFTMVLEDMRSSFKVFGEMLQETDKKVDRIDRRLNETNTKLGETNTRLDGFIVETRDNFKTVNAILMHISEEISLIKRELKRLDKEKTNWDWARKLEARVAVVEQKMESVRADGEFLIS